MTLLLVSFRKKQPLSEFIKIIPLYHKRKKLALSILWRFSLYNLYNLYNYQIMVDVASNFRSPEEKDISSFL